MSDCHAEKVRTARKPYRCEEAGPRGCTRTAKIKPGMRYAYVSGVFEGEPYNFRLCLRCSRAWSRAWERWKWWGPHESPAVGELTSFLRDERSGRPWEVERWRRMKAKELRDRGLPHLAEQWEAQRG